MKKKLQIITAARAKGKIIREYADGSFSIQSPEKAVATVYKPDGTEYRIPVSESLDALYASEYPRK
jgi:hypothetical protein